MQPSFLDLPGKRLAYHLSEGKTPSVIFLGGFKSDMTGSKATALESYCQQRGQRFVRFDYTGHGRSSGDFMDGTIAAWKQDARDVIDRLGTNENILVGSSMGAWLGLLCALERKDKIKAFIGIASAPDFTERLIWEKMDEEQHKQMREQGAIYLPSCYGEAPYAITHKLIEDARAHLLLSNTIPLDMPIRLIHGTHDEDVPWQMSAKLMECLSSKDVRLTLVKGGNHRMSEPDNLQLLCNTLEWLLTTKGNSSEL